MIDLGPCEMMTDIEDEQTKAIRSDYVRIKYDYLPKYCMEYKLQVT